MKNLYILILLIFISCAQKENKDATVKVQDTVKLVVSSPKKVSFPSFMEVISETKTRPIPLLETTNFDSFIEEGDYNKVEIEVLKLTKIHPNFYKKEYNFKAIASYKIDLFSNFYSVVVTVLKGDYEMESVLINYDLKGKIIDYKVVSFDEVAESIYRIESKIEQDKLTIKSIADLEEKSEEIEVFKIDAQGKINPIKAYKPLKGKDLIEDVIQKLKLNKLKIKYDFASTKTQPNNPNETIVVIPEIALEEEDMFRLNSYIVLVDNSTGKITHKYFESSKTNGWESDAIMLSEIKIDTAPYMLSKDTRAFGIRLYHHNMSQPNPYGNKTISLFVKSGNTLKKVLANYDVMNSQGEWNTICTGEFTDVKNTLIMSKKISSNYFDIMVKSKTTKTKSFKDKNGECDDTKKISVETKWLKFNGDEYI